MNRKAASEAAGLPTLHNLLTNRFPMVRFHSAYPAVNFASPKTLSNDLITTDAGARNLRRPSNSSYSNTWEMTHEVDRVVRARAVQPTYQSLSRLRKHQSCTTLTLTSHAGSVSWPWDPSRKGMYLSRPSMQQN